MEKYGLSEALTDCVKLNDERHNAMSNKIEDKIWRFTQLHLFK